MRTPYNEHRWDYGNWNRTLDDTKRWGFWGGRGDMNAMRAQSEEMQMRALGAGGGGTQEQLPEDLNNWWKGLPFRPFPFQGAVPNPWAWRMYAEKERRKNQGMNPEDFYKQLFEKLDPFLMKAIQKMIMTLPYGAPQAELDAGAGKLRENAIIGATDLAQIARAQFGSGAGSVARPVARFGLGQAERAAGEMEATARTDAQNRPLKMVQILMSLLQPEVLAQLNADKAGVDYARSQSQRQLWQSIGQGLISGGFG
jgi:hypothetical protein